MRCAIITQSASKNTQLLQNVNISVAHSSFYSFLSSVTIIIIILIFAITTKLPRYQIQCLYRGGTFLKYFSFYEFLRLPDNGRISRLKHVTIMNASCVTGTLKSIYTFISFWANFKLLSVKTLASKYNNEIM
jgi:hypothetical protein